MTQTIKSLLDRIKHLDEFEVTTELPEGFSFNGVVPYDIKIVDNMATFKVLALSTEEATDKVNKYLGENTEF